MNADSRELSHEELAFIEESLAGKKLQVEVSDSNEVSVTKRADTSLEKQVKKAYRKKRITLFFLRAAMIIPFILSIIFFAIVQSFVNFAQGDVALMMEQVSTVYTTSDIMSASSMENMKTMASIYEKRWIVVAVIFTVFAVISAILTIIYWNKDETHFDLLEELEADKGES